jgi:hypothetical protein
MNTLFSSIYPLLLHAKIMGFTLEYGGTADLISPEDILDYETEIADVDKQRIKQFKPHKPDEL